MEIWINDAALAPEPLRIVLRLELPKARQVGSKDLRDWLIALCEVDEEPSVFPCLFAILLPHVRRCA